MAGAQKLHMDHVTVTRLGLDVTTYFINVQSLALPITKIGKSMQNIENGVVWGSYGHSRSLEIAPFDRTRSFYSLPL